MRILPGPTDAYLDPRTRTSPIGVYLVDSLPWFEVGSAVMGEDGSVTLTLEQYVPPGATLHIRRRPPPRATVELPEAIEL